MSDTNDQQLEFPWPWPKSIETVDNLDEDWDLEEDYYDSLEDLIKQELGKLESKKTV